MKIKNCIEFELEKKCYYCINNKKECSMISWYKKIDDSENKFIYIKTIIKATSNFKYHFIAFEVLIKEYFPEYIDYYNKILLLS